MGAAATTPLTRRLGIKPGHEVVVMGMVPPSFVARLDLPPGARVFRRLRPGPIDVLISFTDTLAELERRFALLTSRLHPDGAMWVCWPTAQARRPTDITPDVIRRVGLAGGMIDNKACAIDPSWRGLRLVVRPENRAALAYRAEPPLSVRRRRTTQPGKRPE
ncbi:MAG: hypothetical protein R3B06_07295 [Kofleriaceae bacterium]